jgi:hypothetical protein
MPPPKLLVQTRTLIPREIGVSNFIGLEAMAEVTALCPQTSATRSLAWPGDTEVVGSEVGTIKQSGVV